MTTEPSWIAVLQGLLTPTIALFGLYIAAQQWLLARNKLKHDLFERRFKVYDAARRLILFVVQSGKMTDEESFKFQMETRDAKWLLDADLDKYLKDELGEKAVDLTVLIEEKRDGNLRESDRLDNLKKQREIKDWLRKQMPVIDSKFSSFLKLTH